MLAESLDRLHKEMNSCMAPFTFMIVQRKLNVQKLEEMIIVLEKSIEELKAIINKFKK